MGELIDLRSDTVTRPTARMRAAMCCTSVGCWVEDSTAMSPSSPGVAMAIWPSR